MAIEFAHGFGFGKLLASASGDAGVLLWDPDSGDQRLRLKAEKRPGWGTPHVSCVAFSPDGRSIAGGGLGNHLGRPIIDQTDPSTKATLLWKDRLGVDILEIRNKMDAGNEKLERLLANLSRQMSVEFKHERRKINVWFVSESP